MEIVVYRCNPRKPLALQVPPDQFLCYRMEVDHDPDSPESKLQGLVWNTIGKPSFVLFGEPAEGRPVYRVSVWPGFPRWVGEGPVMDPGPLFGFLTAQTLEGARVDAEIAKGEKNENAILADELPTWIGDRKTWQLVLDLEANALAKTAFGFLDDLRQKNYALKVGWGFQTQDLDFQDRAGALRTMKRRFADAFPGGTTPYVPTAAFGGAVTP